MELSFIRDKYGGLSYQELLSRVKEKHVPIHLAVIMDGNGRWAKSRGLPRQAGHKTGVDKINEILAACNDLGIEILTLYAFSTENWRRPETEVNFLMDLFYRTIKKEYKELHRNNIKVRFLGQRKDLPQRVSQEMDKVTSLTENNDSQILNLALNYGGRAEIIEATRDLLAAVKSRKIHPDEIDEDLFSSYLDTGGLPDPELLIRFGGEMRISNFLLWQLAYAEILVTETFWPDFTREELCLAILEFQDRERRFGGV